MKKQWIAGLLCCLLLLPLSAPVRAAGSVYFVAAEESVLPLTDETMPFWANGYLYVSTSVFTSFGISVINNTGKRMTVLEKDRRALLFDWEKGTAQDSSGTAIAPGSIQSGSSIFVPAATVAVFFDLLYSVTEVSNGYLVWLRSPDFGMNIRDFANAATYNMEERYSTYRKESQSGSSPLAPSTPVIPADGARIHLCIEADQRAGSLLDALERAGGWATFYCSPDYLEENGDLLRRMTASGHTVGILIDEATPAEEQEAQLRRGNEALCRATLSKTRLVYLRGGSEEATQALTQSGWCCLTPALDRTDYQLESTSNAASLLRRVAAWRGDVSVWLGTTAAGAGIREFVTSAQNAGHYCRALTETG